VTETSEREDGSAIDAAIEHLNAYGPREYADAVRKLRIAAENAKAELDARKPSRPVTEQQDDAAGRVRRIVDGHARNTDFLEFDDSEVDDLRAVLRQLDDAKTKLAAALRTVAAAGALRAEVERLTRERDDYRTKLTVAMRVILAAIDAKRGQETAQEAAGDDPGGPVGDDARDTLRGRENGAEDVGSET
jgi:hypothetical protein